MAENKAGRTAETQSNAQAPKGINYVLVIAIDAYVHCPPLYNCVKDAHDLIELLTERYQFERNNFKEIFNAAATRANIYNAFRDLAQRVTPNDNLLIYFSGHGEYDPVLKRGFWIPVDANPGDHYQYISNSDIKDFLAAINSHHTFLMADSCFSGALFAKGVAKNITKRYEIDPSRWGLTAGRTEIVSDGKPGDNSPFAESLLYRLRQNTDALGVAELCAYVTEYVQAKTNQTPIGEPLKVEGHKNGQFVFHLKKDEARDWEATHQHNTLAAYERFLGTYPNGTHAEEARSTIGFFQEESAWQEAKDENTIASYERYLSAFPQGRYRRQAIDAQRVIEETEAWQRTTRRNAISAYREFQDNYPNSKYYQEAEERIAQILNRHASKSIAKPGPKLPYTKKPINYKPYLIRTAGVLLLAIVFLWIWSSINSHQNIANTDTGEVEDTSAIQERFNPDSNTYIQNPAPDVKKEQKKLEENQPPKTAEQTNNQATEQKRKNTTPTQTETKKDIPQQPIVDHTRVEQHIYDAIAFLKAGLTKDAKNVLQQAQKLDAKNTNIKDAIILIDAGDLDGALQLIEKALK